MNLMIGTGMNGMSWGMGFACLAGLAILLLITWAFYQKINSGSPASNKNKSALDILKERYARGEIDKKEFEDKNSVLSHQIRIS